MTATEYEQQAHRTIAGHAAENITYLSFGLMAEAGEVAKSKSTTTKSSSGEDRAKNSLKTSPTNLATCFGSLQ